MQGPTPPYVCDFLSCFFHRKGSGRGSGSGAGEHPSRMGCFVTALIKNCIQCQKSKIHRHVALQAAHIPVPVRRFSHLHVDLVGPLPRSSGFSYLVQLQYIIMYILEIRRVNLFFINFTCIGVKPRFDQEQGAVFVLSFLQVNLIN